MTIRHKLKLIPARILWFMRDLIQSALFYKKYKKLDEYIKTLESEYLDIERTAPNNPEVVVKKARYEVGLIILQGKYGSRR